MDDRVTSNTNAIESDDQLLMGIEEKFEAHLQHYNASSPTIEGAGTPPPPAMATPAQPQSEPSNTTITKSLRERIMARILSAPDDEDGHGDKDICRVCRLSGDDTLYHPCLCTGSIKYVHQECLLQWLKYSKKDVCELCNHKFSFRPLYRADMPERLPIWDLLRGVFLIMARFMRLAFTYLLVASCWLGLVPLMAARIHRLVFSGLLTSFFSSRILILFSTENVAVDIARGSLVVTLFICTFISLVWLREQIMIGGPGHLLHLPEEQQQQAATFEGAPHGQQQAADQRQPIQDHQHQQTETATPAEAMDQPLQSDDVTNSDQQPTTSSSVGNDVIQPEHDDDNNIGNLDGQLPQSEFGQQTAEGEPQQQQNQRPSPLPQNRSSAIDLQMFQPVRPALVDDHHHHQQQQQRLAAANNQNQQNNNIVVAAAAAENAVDMIGQQQQQQQNQQQRFVDELTWQRLLGLDGSFAFIEHVFWTISLNIVFNIVFLYFPAQIGSSMLAICGFGPGKIHYFELPISIIVGLFVVLVHGVVIHRLAKIFRLKTLYTTAGMICLMLKVFLLVVVELIIFPVLCGWWLDICSLPLTGVTLDERIRNFRLYPSSSMFLHWLAGMVYVFYSASFILILRELLRPGVLWFIRNLNDPDFNPIQEMIEQPVSRHIRRLISSMTLFFSIIMLVVYVPLRIIKWVHSPTLPYVFTGSADTPLVEYSFELILLQVIMPTILEYSKAFSLLKRVVRYWCRLVGGWLQLDSYLLPAAKAQQNQQQQDLRQREQQRQRARERLMRGDQNEQIGLLEVLDVIEDDTEPEDEAEHDQQQRRRRQNEDGNEVEGRQRRRRRREVEGQQQQDNNNGSENEEDNSTAASSSATSSSSTSSTAEEQESTGDDDDEDDASELEEQADAAGQDAAHGGVQQENQNDQHQEGQQQQQRNAAQPQPQILEQRNLGAQHQALLRFRDPTVVEDYVRPSMFPLRIAILLMFVAITAVLLSLIFFLVPVNIGRALLKWLALTNQPVHDLYTVALGLYTCWLSARVAMLSREWAQKGWSYVKKVFSSIMWLILRIFAASIPLIVVIPFMLGFYFQLLVISPLRVAIFQSPLFFPWKEWAMGVVHFKIICASILMGPDWWLKAAFEQIYADGIWNFRLRDLYTNLVLPILNALAFLIAFPYVFSKFLLLFAEATREEQVIVVRYSYPFLLGSICTLIFLTWQWQKLKLLAQKIRNDKYLIGTQLVNFYRENTPAVMLSSAVGSSSLLKPVAPPTAAAAVAAETASSSTQEHCHDQQRQETKTEAAAIENDRIAGEEGDQQGEQQHNEGEGEVAQQNV